MKQKKKITIIIIAVIIIAAIAAIAVAVINSKPEPEPEPVAVVEPEPEIITPDEPETKSLEISNPINFDEYWAINQDVYAYIYVDGTYVDYPMLQSSTDDLYYLEYNIDGSKGYPGCIYTEMANAKDFTDPNTVIYGHNMRNGTMFNTLHRFEDADFFAQHNYVYIYTPEEVLQYRIFAGHLSDSYHILKTHDFSDQEVFATYLNDIFAETDGNIDLTMQEQISVEDTIITMSTCTGNDDTRWLVQGVLVNRFACPYGETVSLELPLDDETTFEQAKAVEIQE